MKKSERELRVKVRTVLENFGLKPSTGGLVGEMANILEGKISPKASDDYKSWSVKEKLHYAYSGHAEYVGVITGNALQRMLKQLEALVEPDQFCLQVTGTKQYVADLSGALLIVTDKIAGYPVHPSVAKGRNLPPVIP